MAANKQRKQLDSLPPQNIEAEQSVLGSLMFDKNGIVRVADILRPEDFYRGSHQIIYKIMEELFEKNEPIDLLSLSNRLQEKEKLKEVGGQSYLTTLINTVPSAANVTHYAKIVRKKKMLRDLIEAAYGITELSYQETEDVENVLDEAEKRIFAVSQRSLKQYFVPIKDALEGAFERVERLHEQKGALRGISTGFEGLDNYLAGLQKSDFIILASTPSIGKTTLALDIARNIAVKEKIPVGLFSLEMAKEQIVDRLLCAQGQVDLWKLRTGKLSSEGSDNDFSRIQDAMGLLSESPIFIDDIPSPNIMQIRTMARRMQAEHGLGLIVIDYLQLIQPRNTSDSSVQQMTEVSHSVKALARELNIPILALSQLSRAVEQRSPRIPRLSDLRESGSLEQDSDVVLFIYREDRDKKETDRKNIADIFIAKHRNGPLGKVELYFDEKYVTFRNLERRLGDASETYPNSY